LGRERLRPLVAAFLIGPRLIRDHDRLDAWTLFRWQRAALDDKLAALGLHSFAMA
jgi:hypothetical protein